MGTIFRPTLLYPSNISLDMSVNQTFTCVIDGQRITGYDINIYNNSDSSLEYTNSVTFTSENYLYNNATLEMLVPSGSCTNGNEYKWSVTYYNGTESVTSQERLFYAASSATFTITVPATINNQGYEFIGSYSQSDGVGVRYWYYELYDESGILLQQLDKQYNANIKATVNGFVSGNTYQIKGFLETEQGVKISTTSYTFDVSYTPVGLETIINSQYISNKTAPYFFVKRGSVDGDYSYVEDLFVVDNVGIDLQSSSTLSYTFDEDIPDTFTLYLDVIITTDFSGDFITLSDTSNGDYYTVGYDDTVEKFYYDINGVVSYSEELYAVSQKVYLVVMIPTAMDVSEYVYKDAQFLTSNNNEFFGVGEEFFFVQYEE